MALAPLCVVLHQIRSPDNLGAVARLMANFGVGALRLSDPATYAFHDAKKMAVGAEGILDHMQVVRSLKEALGEVVYACGTTSRTLEGRTALAPEQAAARLAEQSARGQVALVLGGEKRGLSDDELSLCDDYLVIPTQADQPSMNLAQAAAVLLYLCSREAAPPPVGEALSGAQLKALEVLDERMGQALLHSGFLNPQAPKYALAELSRSLRRGQLSQREAEMWIAAFKSLGRER